MQHYIIGIDTGGTCTDAVLVEQHTNQIMGGVTLSGFLSSYHQHQLITLDFGLKVPLVGLGAAAPYFLPAVAKKLATTASFPPYSEVGNGVGATCVSGKNNGC